MNTQRCPSSNALATICQCASCNPNFARELLSDADDKQAAQYDADVAMQDAADDI